VSDVGWIIIGDTTARLPRRACACAAFQRPLLVAALVAVVSLAAFAAKADAVTAVKHLHQHRQVFPRTFDEEQLEPSK
jgi:hypothetical protein